MTERTNKDPKRNPGQQPQKPQPPPERKPGSTPGKEGFDRNYEDKKRSGRGMEEPMDREEVEDNE